MRREGRGARRRGSRPPDASALGFKGGALEGRRAVLLGTEVGRMRLVAWSTHPSTEISLCSFWNPLLSVSSLAPAGGWG